MVNAAKCRLVASCWVYQFILTCDGELAVTFKRRQSGQPRLPFPRCRATPWHVVGGVPAVTRLYRGTREQHFNQAVLSPSAGQYVSQVLGGRPCQLIPNPCPAQGCKVAVPCCPGTALARQLATDFLNATGRYTCLSRTVVCSYDDNGHWLNGELIPCGGESFQGMTLYCSGESPDSWDLDFQGSINGLCALTSAVCDPLELTFRRTTDGDPAEHVDLVITEW